jgi:hypothetical protein
MSPTKPNPHPDDALIGVMEDITRIGAGVAAPRPRPICDACLGTGRAPAPPAWHHAFLPICQSCQGTGRL